MKVRVKYFDESDNRIYAATDEEIANGTATIAQRYVRCVTDAYDDSDKIYRANFLVNVAKHESLNFFLKDVEFGWDSEVVKRLPTFVGDALHEYIAVELAESVGIAKCQTAPVQKKQKKEKFNTPKIFASIPVTVLVPKKVVTYTYRIDGIYYLFDKEKIDFGKEPAEKKAIQATATATTAAL